ncbi:MAG TPA: metallophosphoesterase family protein [Gemmataceae bacterium]|jgi:Icc-related predicted phosphoesterase|nr:metallophosphoesterase family protein [Gemmataceae bacterium]
MKLLLFSDLHCSVSAARRMVELARGVDVAIGAGDFGQVRRRVGVCIDILRDMPCPTVVVPGNNESLEELQAACAGWAGVHVLHGNSVTIHGVTFFGLGGGVPITPFGSWSWDFSEEQAKELLQDFPPGGVLVSHSPPKGCLDVDSNDTSRGSSAVRDLILAKRPALVVCGHIHACGGRTESFHGTTVVNAGPGGVEITVN